MSDPSPRCPGCGYPIFGLRDMRCPECGRVLDVRDFNPDFEDNQGRARRLRRDGRIGVGFGLFFLLIPTVGVLFLAGVLIYHGYNPGCAVTLMVIVFVVWVGRVLGWIGREAMPTKKRRP
jgi:hypothetical protein